MDSDTWFIVDGPESNPGRGAIFFARVYTGRRDRPAFYTMNTGSFLRVKRPGPAFNHPPTSSAEVKERVELYLYSACVSSWLVYRSTFTFTFYFNGKGPDISLRKSSCLFQSLLKIAPQQSAKTESMWRVLIWEVQPNVCINSTPAAVFKLLPLPHKHTLIQLTLFLVDRFCRNFVLATVKPHFLKIKFGLCSVEYIYIYIFIYFNPVKFRLTTAIGF